MAHLQLAGSDPGSPLTGRGTYTRMGQQLIPSMELS